MAIVQISKIQQRSGNLVDLPQLDEAEFGWASDAKRLFIGKTATGGSIENVEVLTSYSNISFSQLEGAVGNLDISALSVDNGQVLTYDGTNWVNRGGDAGGLINLGSAANVKINGGAIGYVLTTDGLGTLTWSPKGTLYTNIQSLTNGAANVITMHVANTTPYVNGQAITISGVQGSNTVPVNGKTFYVKLNSNFAANSSTTGSGNVTLYTDSGLATTANGYNLTATANTGIATAIVASGSGSAAAGGVDTNIQYNANGIIAGDAGFSFNASVKSMALTGNATVGNLNTAGKVTASTLISNVATGTAPFTVSSTTQVANLNVATAGTSGTVTTNAQPNITSTGTLTSLSVSGNANVGNIGTGGLITATGNLSAGNVITGGIVSATGNGTFGNVIATLHVGNLSGTGNSNVGNLAATGQLISTIITGTAPLVVTSTTQVANLNSATAGLATFATTANAVAGANVSGQVANALVSGTVYTNAQPNITSVGTLASLSVTANANIGNIGTAGLITATGNLNAGNVITGGIVSATGNGTFGNVIATAHTGTTVSVTGNANVGNLGTGGLITATGNVTAGNLVTGGVVSASGNASVLGIKTDNYYYANGAVISFAGTYSNSNVASYLPTFTGTVGATVLTTGANTTLGTITGNWALSAGSRLSATYADIAEYYDADAHYEPGTVLAFGGEKEVTIAEDGTTRVAGVVSTNPAYAMNAKCPGIAVAIALQGRVPTKVRGTIRKGDLMVSAGDGYARPWNNPQMGTVIGKALENFDGIEGVIEVAVGRL